MDTKEISFNQYIYKSRDLMRKSLRFCHVTHSMKRIEVEILLEIRTNLKIETFYFLWFNVSRLLFITFFIQCFKTSICFISFNISRSLSYTKNFLHIHSHFSLLLFYIHMLTAFHTHLKYTSTKNDVICLQPSNDTYITPTLQYYLILTRMSWL